MNAIDLDYTGTMNSVRNLSTSVIWTTSLVQYVCSKSKVWIIEAPLYCTQLDKGSTVYLQLKWLEPNEEELVRFLVEEKSFR